MLNFIKSLFSIKKADRELIIGNISEEEEIKIGIYNKEHEQLFAAYKRNIQKITGDKTGLINDISLKKDESFVEVKLKKSPSIVERKRGISKVTQELHLDVDISLLPFFELAKKENLAISFLFTDTHGHSFLYGEHNGLFVDKLDDTSVELFGEEADVFYRVSKVCVNKLTNP